jgi:hypothetical protein
LVFLEEYAVKNTFWSVAGAVCVVGLCAGCEGPVAKAEKALAGKQLTFAADIQPIVAARCQKCHVDDEKGKLSLASLDTALKGGKSGAVVVPGDADKSRMYQLVAGLEAKKKKMPPKGESLTPMQIATIKVWIRGGAK